ncbi:uncharacterized protein PAC_16730 [Phialocephala subalpina]|uniref:2EXR domain-containing protein n=1 Tax=Phialocephala subalpina TaxID=576137 RepID=A0A1L7XP66_9HELO|nr:uncharacterized protein PAC_16730 [Phialocephala subalpina]
MTSLTQFDLFPELPIEIRLKIWGTILTTPRTLTISCKRGITDINRRITEAFICHDPPHPLLHVNNESRFEALNNYGYTPMFMVETRDRATYVNFDYDTIRCAASMLEYLGKKEIKDIQRLVLEVGDAAYFGHFHMDTITRMESLKELTLEAKEGENYGWNTGRNTRGSYVLGTMERVVHGLNNDIEGARHQDLGWRCPRVRIVRAKDGELLKVLEGGALVEGWKEGDEYPEQFL